MEEHEKDILQTVSELKQTPYCVPDGYFSSLKEELKTCSLPHKGTAHLRPGILRAAFAMAAMLALLLTVGILFSARPVIEDEFTQEDLIVFSSGLTNIALYEEDGEQYASAEEIDAEDIIEYLIYTGVSTDIIEQSR